VNSTRIQFLPDINHVKFSKTTLSQTWIDFIDNFEVNIWSVGAHQIL